MFALKLLRPSKKLYTKEIFGCLLLVLAVYFFKQQHTELSNAFNLINHTKAFWIGIGISITAFYILLNGLMYRYSFKVINSTVPLKMVVQLFLKRNLISVFLPGGGITSLVFFSKDIETAGISKTKINFASYIYGIIGIASLVVFAFPVLIYTGIQKTGTGNQWAVFIALAVLVAVIAAATRSILKRGILYRTILRFSPEFEVILTEITAESFSVKYLSITLLCSVLIEVTGVVHLYVAMLALGLQPNMECAILGYTIATLFLCISPFLRGLGAVEISLTFILTRYGFTPLQAVSITLLYRIFEFWTPLLAGLFSFIFNKGNIILRIFPAILIFLLGIVNIISVITPALANRLKIIHEFLPVEAIKASNYLVLVMGIILIINAGFLLRGLRSAWYIALVISCLSLIGHLTKAIDYEEALLAFFAIVTLAVTYEQYYIRSNKNIQSFNFGTALWTLFAILIYGVVGFYFLNRKHFGLDFNLAEAVKSTIGNFILINQTGLEPHTTFARMFLHSINILGIGSVILTFYSLIKPYVQKYNYEETLAAKAKLLLDRYGKSSVDYFKTYYDKLLFFGVDEEGFVSYKLAGGFAIVLEEPVCESDFEVRSNLLKEFEAFCYQNGLKPSYYRIDEVSVELFEHLGKKSLIIGQEAIIDIRNFSLEGRNRKSLRNALNSLQKKGFKSKVYEAPISEALMQQLQSVSNEWLETMNRKEIVFSQGMFSWEELKNQTIITLENEEGRVVAFLNIIPDYAKGEATYDMIRKTADAPGGNMDMLIIELISYCKVKGYNSLNMGMAPLSGIEKAKDIPERTVKFAYEKIRQFRHYKGLRDFKEKFDPQWQNKYLIYENHYDLLQLPMALTKVMKP